MFVEAFLGQPQEIDSLSSVGMGIEETLASRTLHVESPFPTGQTDASISLLRIVGVADGYGSTLFYRDAPATIFERIGIGHV